MLEIVDLKTELVEHTIVHLAIGLHKTKHKSLVPLFTNHASLEKN